MIFAVLFFVSFVIGLGCFLASDRWWLGGVICSALGGVGIIAGLVPSSMQGLAVYFGIPIIFLGSLFGAYIVQLRRAPEIESLDDDQSETAPETEAKAQTDKTDQ